ncbi:MAG: hypothetical protein K9L17_10295 [Clostridiales bacterium]|nr:hypothetical protein [Clostridiales bacterium]MCF8023071.1 hypothetical protein [Clostridiales bacterium]
MEQNKLPVRQRKYNCLIENYLFHLYTEMHPQCFKIYVKVLSPLENWLHWKREEFLDEETHTLKYKASKYFQGVVWGVLFFNMEKGHEIVNKIESFIWESQK